MPLVRRNRRPAGPGRVRSPGRLGPVLLAVGLVVGVASSVGAQVDPVFPTPQSVWSATCLGPGATELVVYGRGWAAGAVALSVTDQRDRVLGTGTATGADRAGGAVFQARVPVALAGATSLRLAAAQGAGTDSHAITVNDSCSPTITAAVSDGSCVPAGARVTITARVGGAPSSIFPLLVHHVDLHGPAEVVDRTQLVRPAGEYTLPLAVSTNVPGRVVPVTVEAQRNDGQFAMATTNVELPPTCPQPGTTTTAGRGTTAPPTTPPPAATTAPPTSGAGSTVPGRPSTFQPFPGGTGAMSLAVSPSVGRAGDATTVAGRGFGPSTTVVLRWRPGVGEWTVTAGGDGSFRTQVLVLPNDIEGPRVLEVVGGGPIPAPFLVVPRSSQPAFGGVFVKG